jgi:hypothetical protein
MAQAVTRLKCIREEPYLNLGQGNDYPESMWDITLNYSWSLPPKFFPIHIHYH